MKNRFPTWTTNNELVGRTVLILTGYDDEELATVIAVSTITDLIRVRSEDDGRILIGNQWEDL